MKNIDQDVSLENLELNDEISWDNRELGADPKFSRSVAVPSSFHELLNKSNNMQMISIRLPQELISDLKMISSTQKMGYQALIRELLKRFVDAEKKVMYQNLRRK
jgi:predicted DNA binding CopG/RHH family protein